MYMLIIWWSVASDLIILKASRPTFFFISCQRFWWDRQYHWLEILRESPTRTLKISQSSYLPDKVNSLGLVDSKSFFSPLDGHDGILLQAEGEPLADDSAYTSAVGSFGYASIGTRPDISFATFQPGAYNSSSVQHHWNSVCRVFQYLKGSSDYCITSSFGPPSHILTINQAASLYYDSG